MPRKISCILKCKLCCKEFEITHEELTGLGRAGEKIPGECLECRVLTDLKKNIKKNRLINLLKEYMDKI